MDNLFGVPLTSIMVGLLLLMGAAFGMLVWIAVRQPLLVRMGIRNIRRRRAQTALIVVGLMLSTLIVSAAFATGDTVGYSVTNSIYEQLEEVDFLIGFDAARQPDGYSDDTFLEALRAEFGGDAGIDGITGTLTRQLPLVNQEQRLSEPSAMVVGVNPETVESFNGLRNADGELVSAERLQGASVYVTERLADDIATGEGGTVTVYFENAPHEYQVVGVVRDTSVTAQGNTQVGGLVMNLAEMRSLIGEEGELSNVVVSLAGGTRGTLEQIDPMQDRLEAFIETQPDAAASVDFTKKELVGIGELVGSAFVTIFLVFGLFSIAAGILLIFLIFVMLAAERRSEMGMARAIGMNRVHLTETFIAEGMAYNIGSALVGVLLGLGVAYSLIFALRQIFAEIGFDVAFHVNPQGVVISYAAGVVVTFATVAFASWRAANLNIVRAIRDLPEPEPFRSTRPSIGALIRAAVGALWYVAWIAIVALGATAIFLVFISSLGFYGLPLLVVVPFVALFVAGVRLSNRGLTTLEGWRPWMLWALWMLFFLPVALLTLGLIASRTWANRHRNSGGWALVMLVIGIVSIYLGGWVWHQAFAYTAGTTLAVLAIAMLAVYFGVASRPAFTIAGVLLVWYWLLPLPFSLLWEGGDGWYDPLLGLFSVLGLPVPDAGNGNIEMFFVSGISITAAATLVVIFNAGILLTLVGVLGHWLGWIAPAVRTAVAYPLAARFRTAMTLSMFGLVVFSLVVMAFLNHNFTQLFLGDGAKAGFDVRVAGNPSNRIPDLRAAVLERDRGALAGVADIGTTVSAFPFIEQDGVSPAEDEDPKQWRYIGADDEFYRVAALPLSRRAIGYDSDEAVFAAVQNDPGLVIGTEEILHVPAGPFGEPGAESFSITQTGAGLDAVPWAPIVLNLRDTETGEMRQVRIIAFTESQVTGVLTELVGLFSTREAVAEFSDGGFADNWFVTTVDGEKDTARRVANGIESALLEQGVQADSLDQIIDDATAQSTAFQYLFQGFMGLGLVVGIAALGVIAFRTVVERRQQIGMLRAIGYSRRLVGLSFFLESSFIASTGIAMGMLLGGALSYNLLSNPENIGAAGAAITFEVPWLQLLLIAGIAYVASALMTLIPARSASRVSPAEALRYE